ncbi:gamma-glutamyltransferase [Methylophilaceae bacterium]|nr:gamma-glutamyltransferase [Methylophilaceae bacterium]
MKTSKISVHWLYILSILFYSGAIFSNELFQFKGAVVTSNALATEAGEKILAEGGNAYDAATTISAMLSVVEPFASGLGGGAFWLIYDAKSNKYKMLDARETAPLQSHKNMYLDENEDIIKNISKLGPLSAGIPGIPAVLSYVNDKYGSKKLSILLDPAYTAAINGFPVNERYLKGANYKKEWLKKYKETEAIFLDKGEVPQKGWILKQADLARTIKKIMKDGHKSFYTGSFAKKMVESVQSNGGIWTEEDLNRYKVLEREPVRSTYKGISIIAPGLPSSGGLVLSNALNILAGYELDKLSLTAQKHLIIESLRRAYYERAIKMGDPDFMDNSLEFLLTPSYAAKQRESININYATDNQTLEFADPPYQGQGNDTTHFSVIDKFGNRVAVTQSINFWFGSAFVPKGTGVLLNNEMDDFSIKPGIENGYGLIGYDANAVEPGKRMLSSMTPTFLESERGFVILGTPGGSRIISMILLATLEWINGGDAKSMVSLPRFHHQYHPDYVLYEEEAFMSSEIDELESMGHTFKKSNRQFGNMQIIMWEHENNKIEIASDPRGKEKSREEVY